MDTDTSRVLNGRYRLLEVAGEGGMAVVWRAEDVLLARTVAIKLLRDQYAADPDFVARFRSEGRAAAALNDPGIVGVYDVGEDGGRHYLVMEYVAGRDLKSLIRAEAPLAPERAVAIGATVARAVAAAHEVGLVHRDIKPQNVLIAPDGRMKVTDFGIARAASAVGTTAPGIVLGTVHYLAPEQAIGEPATFASDVYALGVVLYEMLSGRVPFEADSAVGVAMKIAHEAPEPLSRLNPRVPPVLVGIVDRAMARQPTARYPDAAAMADALAGYARWSDQATMGVAPAVAVTADPARPVPAATRMQRDGPLFDWTGLALGLVALAAVAGLVPLWLAVALQPESPDASPTAPPTVVGTPTATADPLSLAQGATQGESVQVPRVVGSTAAEATQLLASQSLGSTTEYSATHSAAAGTVVGQSPEPGTTLPAGSVVRLFVSGRALILVPELAGDYATVAAQLERVGLVPRQMERWGGDGAPVGTVMGFNPLPGVRVPAGSPVDVIVNSGSWLALGVDFADHIHLPGVALPRDTVLPGESLHVGATWEAVEVVAGDYVARVLLVDEAGQVVAMVERTPGGDRPTNTWQPAEVFAGDGFDLAIPPDVAPGEYTLALELAARSDPGQRLDVLQSAYARTDGPRVIVRDVSVAAP